MLGILIILLLYLGNFLHCEVYVSHKHKKQNVIFQTPLSARNRHVTRNAMGRFDSKWSSVRKLPFCLALLAEEASSFWTRNDVLSQKWHWCWNVAVESGSQSLLPVAVALTATATLSQLRQSHFWVQKSSL